jgi:uncharacterized coiled-coil DUF342 family protein
MKVIGGLKFSEWEEKYENLQSTLKDAEEEMQKISDEKFVLSRRIKQLQVDIKTVKIRNKELTHDHEVVSNQLEQRRGSMAMIQYKQNELPFVTKGIKTLIKEGVIEECTLNKIGVLICSYFKLSDYRRLGRVSRRVNDYFIYNVEIVHLMNNLHSTTSSRYKKELLSLKSELSTVKDELRRKHKYMNCMYDETREDVRTYIKDMMDENYDPAENIKKSIDESCNMIINYSRLTNIEDPIDRIRKEMKNQNLDAKEEESPAMSYIKKSIMSLGNSFGPSDSDKNKIALKETSRKNSSFDVENEDTTKAKGYRSNGIFDTLFKPLEIRPEDKSRSKPPLVPKFPTPKIKDTNHEIETEDDFFGQNLNNDMKVRSGTI